MKPVKIIELSGFSRVKIKSHPLIGSDNYYVTSWAGLFARRLANKYPDLDIECWRAEPDCKKIMKKKVFHLQGVIFPYKKPVIKNILTLEMVKTLKKLESEYRLVIHYHTIFDPMSIILPYILRKTSIILTHHGGGRKRISSRSLKNKFTKYLIKKSYKRINSITYLRREVHDFITSLIPQYQRLFFMPVGADFEIFQPENKIEARKKIGIDTNKIYGIYVGNFYKLKNVDLILKIYGELKDKFNFAVIFVGGENNMENDVYNEVKNSGCPYFGYQKWTEMKWFYSAADFYIHPAFNKNFMGLDVSLMEALACNIPVMSPQLSEFDFDVGQLGICLNNIGETPGKTKYMIEHFSDFKNCRNSAQKHLDANDALIDKLYTIMMGEKLSCHQN